MTYRFTGKQYSSLVYCRRRRQKRQSIKQLYRRGVRCTRVLDQLHRFIRVSSNGTAAQYNIILLLLLLFRRLHNTAII